MAAISGYTSLPNNHSSNSYGLLSNELTAVMQRDNNILKNDLLVVGRKGVFSLKMLYDWWLIYANNKGLITNIENGQWITPNEILDALLADEYIKYGARAGTPFRIQTYLTMLGHQLSYDYKLDLDQPQLNYLSNQANTLRSERQKIKLGK